MAEPAIIKDPNHLPSETMIGDPFEARRISWLAEAGPVDRIHEDRIAELELKGLEAVPRLDDDETGHVGKLKVETELFPSFDKQAFQTMVDRQFEGARKRPSISDGKHLYLHEMGSSRDGEEAHASFI